MLNPKALTKTIALVPLLAWMTPSVGAELSIGAGPEDGEYTQTIVPAINKALSEAGENTATAVVSPGSQANIEQLISGELSLALVQLDVLALNSQTDESLHVLGLIAPEALLCAAKEGGSVRSYYNLTDKYSEALSISVGAPESGSARTMEFLLALDPELDPDKLDLIYEENTSAELDRLAAGSRDLVCFVRMPNPDNELLAKVNDDDDIFFIDYINAAALEPMYGEIPLYETVSVPVSKGVFGFRAAKIDTLTTWVALVARSDIDPELAASLEQIVANPELLPPTTAAGKAKKMFGTFKEKTGEWTATAKVKAGELAGKAKEKASAMAATAKEKASSMAETAKEKASELKDKAVEMKDKVKDAVTQ